MNFFYIHSEVSDTKRILFHILGNLEEEKVDFSKYDEYRKIVESNIIGTGVDIDFNKWEEFDFWQYGTLEDGFLSLSFRTMTHEGGPALNDTYTGESYYITLNKNPLIISTYGYTRQGCFLITNNESIVEKAKEYLLKKTVFIRNYSWDTEEDTEIPWLSFK